MAAPETNIADVLPEPADGTKLVRVEYDCGMTVIWREDSNVCANTDWVDERWFDGRDNDPMEWREILRYATAVHAISAEPLATLPAAKAGV
jgi:hypothetical protein